MQWPDAVNGTFELGGGFMLLKNIIRLRKDRMVSRCRLDSAGVVFSLRFVEHVLLPAS